MNKDQNGFSVFVVIIFIAIIIVLAIVGHRVVSDSKDTQLDTSKKINQEQMQDQALKEPTTVEETYDAGTGYIELEEWGIKIALRDYNKVQFEVKNEKGSLHDSSSYDSHAKPSFRSEFLQNKSCEPGVGIFRSSKAISTYSKKIGEYYYVITGGPGACSDDPENNPDDHLKARFLEDFITDNLQPLE